MNVSDVMTASPACCSGDTSMQDAARQLLDSDCGALPVADSDGKLQGIVTDRDIACRGVAQGLGPDTPVSKVMSDKVVTASPDDSLSSCCDKMENEQIRRVAVVDKDGSCCGMVSQADVALKASADATAEVVRDVSQRSSGSNGCC